MIGADDLFALAAVLSGLALFGFWADNNVIGKKTSGVVWVISLGILLANTGVVPLSSPVYGFVGGTLMPLAIPLLLFKADMRRIFNESGRVMLGFAGAVLATLCGALIGFVVFDLGTMGPMGPKVAAVYSAGWIGGAVNFVAVSEALAMTPEQFSVAIGASSPVSVIALMALVALPSITLVRRWVPSKIIDAEPASGAALNMNVQDMPLLHTTAALTLSGAICALSQVATNLIGHEQYFVLFITVITLVVANVMPSQLRKLRGDFSLGMLIMYLFFAMIGCSTDATSFLTSAVVLFFYGLTIIGVHLLIIICIARLFKIDLAEMLIASAAAMVGPAPAAAIASARNWPMLVTPGIMCGIFGYAIANFIGVFIGKLLGA